MLQRKAVTACAAMALAMVFSVQQGEHGPLVVYKLQLPKPTTEGARQPARTMAPTLEELLSTPAAKASAKQLQQPDRTTPAPVAAPAKQRLSPLKPSILGTVVMPRSGPATPDTAQPLSLLPEALWPVPDAPAPDTAPGVDEEPTVYRLVLDEPSLGTADGAYPAKIITLDAVTRELEWRRQTRQRLPEPPSAPRF